jgi:hypothetical protein
MILGAVFVVVTIEMNKCQTEKTSSFSMSVCVRMNNKAILSSGVIRNRGG